MTIKNVNNAYKDLILKLRNLGFNPDLKDLMKQISIVLKEQGKNEAILFMEQVLTNHYNEVHGTPCGSRISRKQYLRK